MIEAHKNRIIVTGSLDEVRQSVADVQTRVGYCFADFTSPVAQADGRYVSTGLVYLGETTNDRIS